MSHPTIGQRVARFFLIGRKQLLHLEHNLIFVIGILVSLKYILIALAGKGTAAHAIAYLIEVSHAIAVLLTVFYLFRKLWKIYRNSQLIQDID